MTSTQSRQSQVDDDDLVVPTFEIAVKSIELDLERQLTAFVDNAFNFEGEFSGLLDLESIGTTTTLLAPDWCEGSEVSLVNEFAKLSGEELSVQHGNIQAETDEPVRSDTIIRTTGFGMSGPLSPTAVDRIPARAPSENSQVQSVIVRSTNPPSVAAPALKEPTIRATQRAEELVVRTTSTGSFPKSTFPDSLPVAHALQGPAESSFRSENAEFEDMPPSTATAPVAPNIAATVDQPAFSLAVPLAPVFSSASYASPANATSNNAGTQAIDLEDVEMSCADVDGSQEFFRAEESLYGTQHNIHHGNAPAVVFPPWTPINNAPTGSLNNASNFVPGVLLPIPNSYTSSEPVYIPRDAPVHPHPHPSIFELIQSEDESPRGTLNPHPFIISPAIVPEHVWQEELAREHLRTYERRSSVAMPTRRTRISAPYFSRTPLLLSRVRRAPRFNKSSPLLFPQFDSQSTCSGRAKRQYASNSDVAVPPVERPVSPTSSFTTEESWASTSSSTTTRSYERKLSSPPPFKRRCFDERVGASPSRSAFGSAFKSIARLLSW